MIYTNLISLCTFVNKIMNTASFLYPLAMTIMIIIYKTHIDSHIVCVFSAVI